MFEYKDLQHYFNSILSKGAKDNTYKFALARFLLDYSQKCDPEYIQNKIKQNEPEIIHYQDIANTFLRYYWHQECKYRIKQNHNEAKPPSIITIIRQVFGERYIPEPFEKMHKDTIQMAQKKIQMKVFGSERSKTSQVIPRFQNVREGRTTSRRQMFYDYDDQNKILLLKPQALAFFNKNHNILRKSVILEWAKFLEKVNTLPRLIAKVESAETHRKSLTKYIKIFKEFRRCFYCNITLDQTETQVDHFIPWSYIFEDEAWNLVIACQKCNNKKSDSLTETYFCDEIIKRNNRYQNRIPELRRSLINIDTGKGWETEIRRHYKNCSEYGFNTIQLA